MKDSAKQIREAYRRLNESYHPILVFYIGDSAGFFSEYNGMILAMLYCLKHHIQFRLYSKDANFRYKNGWSDFFESFCIEEESKWHHWVNMRPIGSWSSILKSKNVNLIKWKTKKSLCNCLAKLYKLLHPNVILTQDIWKDIYSNEQGQYTYNIPELSINGSIIDACKVLVEITWNFRQDVQKDMQSFIDRVNITNPYIGCQIRAGDKYIEYDLLPIERYIEPFEVTKDIDNIFVLTDDYLIIERLKKDYQRWHWHTLCEETECGYIHAAFKDYSAESKRRQLLKFFASVEIIHGSDLCFATITSNPSLFFAFRDPEKTRFVDFNRDVFSFMLS